MATDIIARGMAGSTKKQLDEYKNNPDVSDIVQTKADLDNYDTSKLSENDIVKVLVDEDEDNKETYYKWVNNTWDYIGGIGPFYTQNEIDTLLDDKLYVNQIATKQTNLIASKNYAVGDILIYEGTVYKVTSAISSGATITIGTNVVATTVEEVIKDSIKNPTITLTQNGTTKGAFSLNQSSNQTIDFEKGSEVTPNPTTTPLDPTLNSIGINGTNYNLASGGGGSTIIPNPTLEGDEESLDGVQIDNTKYKVGYEAGSNISIGDKLSIVSESKSWTGLTNFYGDNIWTDGDNIYYSKGSSQYVLDKSTSTWSGTSWYGLTVFYGKDVWTNGGNIYCSQQNRTYMLDKSTSTWTKVSEGVAIDGYSVWTDGENTYYSYSNYHYVWDNGHWTTKTWNGLTNFDGRYVWTDGTNTYYSKQFYVNGGYINYSGNYILNKSTSTWTEIKFNGLTEFDGEDVINYKGYTIYISQTSISSSIGELTLCYLFNKESFSWIPIWYSGFSNIFGAQIWIDDDDIYCSQGGDQYVLYVKYENTIESNNSGNQKSISSALNKTFDLNWEQVAFDGIYGEMYSNCVWTDGDNVYYSHNDEQKIWDKANKIWMPKSWGGLYINGRFIWSRGYDDSSENEIYLSYGNDQKVLDKATSTWTQKTWSGLTNFYGDNIWTDGTNIYYSSGTTQKVLDLLNDYWVDKTWGGLTDFYGYEIWSDGTNIYYRNYVLDKSTSTWNIKKWKGLQIPFSAESDSKYIWTDGNNIYYSYAKTYDEGGFFQYNYLHLMLDKCSDSWYQIYWPGMQADLNGWAIWSDGEDVYFHNYTITTSDAICYKLVKPNKDINCKPLINQSTTSSTKQCSQPTTFAEEVICCEKFGLDSAYAIDIDPEKVENLLLKKNTNFVEAPIAEGTLMIGGGVDTEVDIIIAPCINYTPQTPISHFKDVVGVLSFNIEYDSDNNYIVGIYTYTNGAKVALLSGFYISLEEQAYTLQEVFDSIKAYLEETHTSLYMYGSSLLDTFKHNYEYSNSIIVYRSSIEDYEFGRITDVDNFFKYLFVNESSSSSSSSV